MRQPARNVIVAANVVRQKYVPQLKNKKVYIIKIYLKIIYFYLSIVLIHIFKKALKVNKYLHIIKK